MAQVMSFKDLIVWQKAMALARAAYELTQSFPSFERYGLADQIRRSAVSIPSNIAEGQARQHTNEFRHFLHVALGSLAELETQTLLARDVSYIREEQAGSIETQIGEVRMMIYGLLRKLAPSQRTRD